MLIMPMVEEKCLILMGFSECVENCIKRVLRGIIGWWRMEESFFWLGLVDKLTFGRQCFLKKSSTYTLDFVVVLL